MSVTVAALFVEAGGVYFGLPDVDPWDEECDARTYAGPHPVIAHPPCQLWVNMAGVNFRRYGKPKNRQPATWSPRSCASLPPIFAIALRG